MKMAKQAQTTTTNTTKTAAKAAVAPKQTVATVERTLKQNILTTSGVVVGIKNLRPLLRIVKGAENIGNVKLVKEAAAVAAQIEKLEKALTGMEASLKEARKETEAVRKQLAAEAKAAAKAAEKAKAKAEKEAAKAEKAATKVAAEKAE